MLFQEENKKVHSTPYMREENQHNKRLVIGKRILCIGAEPLSRHRSKHCQLFVGISQQRQKCL